MKAVCKYCKPDSHPSEEDLFALFVVDQYREIRLPETSGWTVILVQIVRGMKADHVTREAASSQQSAASSSISGRRRIAKGSCQSGGNVSFS